MGNVLPMRASDTTEPIWIARGSGSARGSDTRRENPALALQVPARPAGFDRLDRNREADIQMSVERKWE